MNGQGHSRRRVFSSWTQARFFLLLSAAILVGALFVSGVSNEDRASFASSELKFADPSPSGLSIVPASCPSQASNPDYPHNTCTVPLPPGTNPLCVLVAEPTSVPAQNVDRVLRYEPGSYSFSIPNYTTYLDVWVTGGGGGGGGDGGGSGNGGNGANSQFGSGGTALIAGGGRGGYDDDGGTAGVGGAGGTATGGTTNFAGESGGTSAAGSTASGEGGDTPQGAGYGGAAKSGGSASSAGTGFTGTYFDNIDLTNEKLQRSDATIDFNWGSGSPDGSVDSNTFSVRWTGTVTPPTSGTYTFYTTTDDGVRLWVNDELIIDDWTNHGATERSGTKTLTGGVAYTIKMEYYDNTSSASAKLEWKSSVLTRQTVPGTIMGGDGNAGGTIGGGGSGGFMPGDATPAGGGGGSGGVVYATYSVGDLTVGSSKSVTVGSGGSAGSANASGKSGGAGGKGRVKVEWDETPTITLKWNSRGGGSSGTITPGVGNVSGVSGYKQVAITEPTVYTLTMGNGVSCSTDPVNLTEPIGSCEGEACEGIDPPSASFWAQPSLVRAGNTTNLYWTARNVMSCYVVQNPSWQSTGDVTEISTTTPAINSQTTYTLRCTGDDQSVINKTAIIDIIPVFEEQ